MNRVISSNPVYLDTSALAKRYLQEVGSNELDLFLGALEWAAISRLVVVEFTCLLGRRRRSREISARAEREAMQGFEQDITAGFFEIYPLEDSHAIHACVLLTKLADYPLRTLDSLHLSVASAMGAKVIATGDKVLATAAGALGFQVRKFGGSR